MAYTLSTAVSELKRSVVWNSRQVTYEPLQGLLDGANTVFFTRLSPIGSSLTLYDSSGSIAATDYSVLSYETGTIQFDDPPVETIYITYTVQNMTDDELLQVVKEGFDEMERRYPRRWSLVSSNSSIYVSSDQNGDTVTDPTTGPRVFSKSRVQIGFYLLCCQYALTEALELHAAEHYFMYREGRALGVAVDRTRNAEHLRQMKEHLDNKIWQALGAAAYDANDQAFYSDYIQGARSNVYETEFDWYKWSDQALQTATAT